MTQAYTDCVTIDSPFQERIHEHAHTVDIGDALGVPKGRIATALLFLSSRWFKYGLIKVGPFSYRNRKSVAEKTAALITHDRILTGELASRGPVAFFIA